MNLDRPDPAGDELVDRLEAEPGDVQVTKHQWGAFHGTPLDIHLRRSGVAGIALTGLMTNFDIESTGRVADELGYRVAFVKDAMASLTADSHRFAVEEIFQRLGDVVTTEQLARALHARAP